MDKVTQLEAVKVLKEVEGVSVVEVTKTNVENIDLKKAKDLVAWKLIVVAQSQKILEQAQKDLAEAQATLDMLPEEKPLPIKEDIVK